MKLIGFILTVFLFSGCTIVYVTVTGNNNSVTIVSDEAYIDEPIQGIYGEAKNSVFDNDEQNTKKMKLGW